jgi:hypothetical protein
MNRRHYGRGSGRPAAALHTLGGHGREILDRLGIRHFRFTPLKLPSELDFTALFHGVRVSYAGDLDAALASIENWRAVGATHVSISTMGAGLSGVDSHVAVLRDMASSLMPGV